MSEPKQASRGEFLPAADPPQLAALQKASAADFTWHTGCGRSGRGRHSVALSLLDCESRRFDEVESDNLSHMRLVLSGTGHRCQVGFVVQKFVPGRKQRGALTYGRAWRTAGEAQFVVQESAQTWPQSGANADIGSKRAVHVII